MRTHFIIATFGRDGWEPSGEGSFATYAEAAEVAQDGLERGVAEIWEIEDPVPSGQATMDLPF